MNDLIIMYNKQLVTSSRIVAEVFKKRHADVLESIDTIIKTENSALTNMFYESTYKAGTGKNYKEYLMNRDGFSLLVMGFTGKDALAWKIKYINAFNNMERKLKEQNMDSYMIDDPVERAKRWIAEEEKRKLLASTVSEQQQMLLAQEPAVNFAKFCETAKTSILIREFCHSLPQNGIDDMGEKNMYKYLVQHKILYIKKVSLGSDGKKNNIYDVMQRYANEKYFDVKWRAVQRNSTSTPEMRSTIKLTVKGQKWLINRLLKEKKANKMENQLALEM